MSKSLPGVEGNRPSGDDRRRGLIVTAAALVVISPDSLIIRILALDTWTLLALRGPLMSLGLFSIVALRYRKALWTKTTSMGSAGVALVGFSAAGSLLFVWALSQTSVSNVLVILAGAPIVAALLGRVFLHESVPPRTWLAIAFAISGVMLIVELGESRTFLGDVAAVGAMLALAATITVTRYSRANDMTPALVGSQMLIGLLAIPLAHFAALGPIDVVLVLLSSLILLPIGNALFISGPRYLPGAEVSLLLPIESILGTVIVWWALGEVPGTRTIIGAFVVLGTIAVHSVLSMRESSRLRVAQF